MKRPVESLVYLEDGRFTINPEWVFNKTTQIGLPKEIILLNLEIEGFEWTSWHESWYIHYEILHMKKSGATEKRIQEKITNFYNSELGKEYQKYYERFH